MVPSGSSTRFDPADWHKLGSWPVYPFGQEPWFGQLFRKTFAELFGIDPPGLLIFDGEQTHEYFATSVVRDLEQHFARGVEFFRTLLHGFRTNRDALLASWKQIPALAPAERFDAVMQRALPLYVRSNARDWVVFIYEQRHHDDIYQAYRSHRGDAAIEEFPVLVTPRMEPETLLEQRGILEAGLAVARGARPEAEGAALAERFGYLSVWIMNDPHDAAWYTRQARAVATRPAPELEHELRRLRDSVKGTEQRQETLQNSARLSKDLFDRLEALRVCTEIRTRGDELTSVTGWLMRQALHPIANELRIPYRDLFFLTIGEVVEVVRTRAVDRDRIAARKRGHVEWTHADRPPTILVGPPADAVRARFLQAEKAAAPAVSELREYVAQRGTATGPVRNLRGGVAGITFNDGDILVAPATTVDFVPLMRRAGAIVTDHGGLTSHAAIVARELGKPCIVGTKHATAIFRDGMVVEVDANAGVVRVVQT